ncbi:MAG: helicase-exonuclease AddAB subunit AddA [Clostridia bacterium]|nr:helicase-exonuclease AddAB subunit AddA [Clostridia bacterium]
MAKNKFTDKQILAIEKECPILVSAAAGSGKTAVLTERVIRKLTNPVSPVWADKLLIVTFTNAAAAEMRERIEKRLYEECAKAPNDKFLKKQKQKLNNADICTIDSFCINLVRENFEKCKIEPNFKVSDGSEMKSVCDNILTEIIDRELENNRETIDSLLEITGTEFDDSALKGLIRELYNYSELLPFPENFLDNLALPFKNKFDDIHPWAVAAKEISKDAFGQMQKCLEKMGDCVLYIENNPEKCDAYVKALSQSFEDLKSEFDTLSFDDLREKLYAFAVPDLRGFNESGPIWETFKTNKASLSANLKYVKEIYSETAEEIEQKNKKMLPAIMLLISLVKDYRDLTFEAFCNENRLSFSQTSQLALKILCSKDDKGNLLLTSEAEEYLSRYDEVFVDEYQDVNDLQNMLFDILSDKSRKLFVVGDIKQSIYRFRGSNLNNFLSKKKTYVPVENTSDEDKKKIILADNFRSRKGICDFVNFVFSKIMTEKTGEIEYGKEEKLNASSTYPESDDEECELLLIDKGDADDQTMFEYEATAIANYINGLINRKFKVSPDGKTKRDVTYGDIAVLFDKLSTKGPVIAKILKDNQIPVSFSEESFSETSEISLLLSLLAVIDNPSKDIELLSCLMSPIFGFSADEVALMKAKFKGANMYSSVLASAENGNEKAKRFLCTIKNYRRDMAILPLSKLLNKLIYDTGIFGFASSLPNSKTRRNNLLSMPGIAAELEHLSIPQFIEHIKSHPEIGFKSDDSKADVVRIMTMHKSKGLQFPICILAGLSSPKNREETSAPIVYKENFGLGIKYFDEEQKVYSENLGRKVITDKLLKEGNEERLRLLYVAMTRAKEKLAMVVSLENSEKTLNRIASKIEDGEIDPTFVKKVNSLSDLVLASCLMHPTCDALRKLGDISIKPEKTESKVGVKVTDCALNLKAEAEDLIYKPSMEIVEKINENIGYRYPYEVLSNIDAKTSVSAIAKSGDSSKYHFADRPEFMNNFGMSSAQKGTAMHKIMQFIEFGKKPNVDAEIQRLVEWQFITEAEGESADRQKLKMFFESPLYERILSARLVKREMRFLTELSAGKIDPLVDEKFKDSSVIVQGAVDLMFEENDGLVVVDFKTDRVESKEELISLYGEQLEIYSKACERIFNKPVNKKIIYSFHLGEIITLNS